MRPLGVAREPELLRPALWDLLDDSSCLKTERDGRNVPCDALVESDCHPEVGLVCKVPGLWFDGSWPGLLLGPAAQITPVLGDADAAPARLVPGERSLCDQTARPA
ncbi:MAG: hypothetical protein AMJ93_15010 [Anaerolineae bacterium SM23_84]|nr:MAG: hypothetical protein AMJ93_15010 [Anaerolineae bacterium SM23_84]